ncbi:FtsX-like permease family protein [Dactylosporangium aurantiacum]|uniref:FtsX-like permease family protein n=1 Tax=Dactylosporangium aurantiacum TaxID=35754 RepID=A0A9Q9IRY2_9ACTN|nr:FtsX-like permease family protein [Dactylosporangium aurantiacum]MDG6106208.1 FtsX-like permease family protein [Dactylosporangium aurantiacum]UWZ58290.1 FtsX-like permease family protein [Dactylosporangium aurantiacum]
MSVAVQDRPLVLGTGHGGLPARRAVIRWAWRLFRREWRQQSLVLTLVLLAVAATTVGLGFAGNAIDPQAATYGTANRIATLRSTGAQADADVAALRAAFGTAEVIDHQSIPLPGSASGIDLRAQDPAGPFGWSTLRLRTGRYPQGPAEVAVTEQVAALFRLTVGGTWEQGGRRRTVVGLVENPLNLRDRFALVAPGQATPAERSTVLLRVTDAQFRSVSRPDGMSTTVRNEEQDPATIGVLVLATIGLLFVGLLAAAGFTVMAQRRMRSLGMLGAIGASHRHVRLVVVANGAVIGVTGALAGAAAGFAAWAAFGPRMEPLLAHRIDRFDLPWLPLLGMVLLAIVTAIGAAWWPARTAARMPVVAALSARPVPPRPAHRFALPGVVLLAAGLGAIVASRGHRAPYIVGGVLGIAAGLLLLAPTGIAAGGRLARFAPLAPRLALRDLARYRARSSAALAAIVLAVGIAAAIALSAAVAVAKAAAPTGGNLPADQLIVWVGPSGLDGPVPSLTPEQETAARQQVDAIAAALHGTSVLPLHAALDPDTPTPGGAEGGRPVQQMGRPTIETIDGRTRHRYSSDDADPLFVATPELLRHYGIDPAGIAADTDLVSWRAGYDGYDIFPNRRSGWRPKVQQADLPTYTSLPGTLITAHAMETLKLTEIPGGWLIHAPARLTQEQIDRAERAASAAGLNVEARPTGADTARVAAYATGTGIALALGVLAMTVGLIRGESARDLRTLTATGAPRRTRRALTAATAGALALLGAVIGTGGAYLALLAWHVRAPHWLGHPPAASLLAILVGLPAVAYAGGWLLSGKEPPVVARQALD